MILEYGERLLQTVHRAVCACERGKKLMMFNVVLTCALMCFAVASDVVKRSSVRATARSSRPCTKSRIRDTDFLPHRAICLRPMHTRRLYDIPGVRRQVQHSERYANM